MYLVLASTLSSECLFVSSVGVKGQRRFKEKEEAIVPLL
jgi:hypothetical protein